MKLLKILFMITIIGVLLPIHLSADEITLDDNSTINGKILKISNNNVIYKDENGAEISLNRLKVVKIKYDQGDIITFEDKLIYTNGDTRSGKVINILDNMIEFNPEGSIPYLKIDKSKVAKVVFENGNVLVLWDRIYLKNGKVIYARVLKEGKKHVAIEPTSDVPSDLISMEMVSRIVYRENREVPVPAVDSETYITLVDNNKPEEKSEKSQTTSEPIYNNTTKSPGKLNNLYLIAGFNFGGGFNSNVDKWNDEYIGSSLPALQASAPSQYGNSYIDNDYYKPEGDGVVGLNFEVRYFFTESLGFGLGFSYFSTLYNQNLEYLANPDMESDQFIGTSEEFYSYDFIMYSKHYYGIPQGDAAVYLLLGAGVSLYDGTYRAGIWTDKSDSDPVANEISREYRGEGMAATLIAEVGVEFGTFSFFTGVKGQYGKIEEYQSDDGEVMSLANGDNVETDLNNFVLYFGSGIGF